MDDSNFFSLDRLVEFGMSAAIAQQMIGSMNQSMQQMFTPGSIQTMPQAQADFMPQISATIPPPSTIWTSWAAATTPTGPSW